VRSIPQQCLGSAAVGLVLLSLWGADSHAASEQSAKSPNGAEIVADPFWVEREAEYRKDPRGPFTAVRADYLKPGESITLFADSSEIGTEPPADSNYSPGPQAIRISFLDSGVFQGRQVPNYEGANFGSGKSFDWRQPIAPDADLRLGRFLLSVDLQEPTLGRVMTYDPGLLDERFHGLSMFARDEKLKVRAIAAPAGGETIVLETSRGLQKKLVKAATLDMDITGTSCRLTGYREPESNGALFVPFRDRTSGDESYGVGRYLRVEWEDGSKEAIVDFNHATNPWCAYSPYYNCILPPPENHLPVEIRAGERAPASHP
jgi:hypothetical protein